MALEQFANQPSTTVSSGGTDAPVSGTQETWTVASSSSFPSASSTASPPTQFHVADTASGKITEIVAVTNVSGSTWTVTRGAEGTTPVTHSAGFTIQQVVTAGWLGSGIVLSSGGGLEQVSALGSVSGAQTLNLANGNVFTVTATGNITFTFSGATSGVACSFTLYLSEDGTGGRTFTWPGSVTWIGGTVPSLNTAPSALNVLVFETLNGGSTWYGSLLAEPPSYPLSSALGGSGTGSPAPAEVLAGGASAGTPFQSVPSSGLPLYVLTDGGTGVVPSFQVNPAALVQRMIAV